MSDYRASPGGVGFTRYMIEFIDDAPCCPDYCNYCLPSGSNDWRWQRGCVTTDLPTVPVYGGAA